MLDAATFLVLHPEFSTCPGAPSGTPGSLLALSLTQAAARIDATVFGALVDEAHGWLTADILACSPWGVSAQMVTTNKITGLQNATIYGQKYTELVQLVGAGYGVT